MIHCFSLADKQFAFDAHSQCLHEVDKLAWRLLTEKYKDLQTAQAELAGQYLPEQVAEAYREIDALSRESMLFAQDPHLNYQPPPAQVKALCLNIAHHCNLACRYCFAGSPSTPAKLMSLEVAQRAVDYLLTHAGRRRHVEIDFFGGEPLLNLPVIRETVAYAQEQANQLGKKFGFTITTNGMLLDQPAIDFILQNEINLVLSIDGRPEVHNALRQTKGGKDSHSQVSAAIQWFLECWRSWHGAKGYYYLRGTFTRHNLDFANDFSYLLSQGFRNISLEPVVDQLCSPHALRWEDLPVLRREYQELAKRYLDACRVDPEVRFFHFEVDLNEGPCLPKRLSGCGAGHAYLAVDAGGELYPCHQLIGQPQFILGTVFTGNLSNALVQEFRRAHIYAKEECTHCWAKYLCSGGCHAHAFLENNSLFKPNTLGCALMRLRLETALYVQGQKQ